MEIIVIILYWTIFQFSNWLKIWSGKWCIKDEHKLLSELGTLTANGSSNAAAASYHYDTHNSFSASLGASGSNANDSMIYESITSRAAPQNALYSPSVQIGGPIGMYLS